MNVACTRTVDLHQISLCNLKILNAYSQIKRSWKAIYVRTDVLTDLAYYTVQCLANNFHSRRQISICYLQVNIAICWVGVARHRKSKIIVVKTLYSIFFYIYFILSFKVKCQKNRRTVGISWQNKRKRKKKNNPASSVSMYFCKKTDQYELRGIRSSMFSKRKIS